MSELELQFACRQIAEAFAERLPGMPYALLLFPDGNTLYISNIGRDQMLKALREFLERAAAIQKT